MRTTTTARRRRRVPRRWLPASGIAVAAVAVAAFVVVALQPSDSRRKDEATGQSAGLRLVTATAGGAFRGLDLESASAAEVLRAAGKAAADGVPLPGPGDWTYVRSEAKSGGDVPVTTMERWTSPDGERSLAVMTVNITNPEHGRVGRSYTLHYEHLAVGIIGDVQWLEQPDGGYERRATWHEDPGDGAGDIDRMVDLTDMLRETSSADDVREALYASVEDAPIEFRDGMACGTIPKYSSCSSSSLVPQAKGLSPEESKRLYLTGQLLTVTLGNVFPPAATKAIYEHLATLPEATVAPATDGSGEVILSLRVKGPSYTTRKLWNKQNGVYYESRPIKGSRYNTKAVAAIDPRTGRMVELGPKPGLTDMSTRYTRFGIAPGPGVGSELCEEFPQPCEEAREFERRWQKDPKAQFRGVVDWMFISQFCDGMINRDGSPKQGNHLPRSMSKDPKVTAEREACERREAAAARFED